VEEGRGTSGEREKVKAIGREMNQPSQHDW
jgi:hypothetical protein